MLKIVGSRYVASRAITTCPAVMFAASRNDRVIGRTAVLNSSINTRKGFSQSGAPPGRKWATKCLGLYEAEEINRAIHRGKPRDSEKKR